MPSKLTIEAIREMAHSKGGHCLSRRYRVYDQPLKWKCAEGHVWKTSPRNVRQGTWCPRCARKPRITIEHMRELAGKRGGKCLSDSYVNSYSKLTWECAKGHRWNAKPNSIKSGTWCPVCSGHARKTIADMQQLALSRGGQCLSKRFVDSKTPLLWQCAKGHTWKAEPGAVQFGTWCPACWGRQRMSIEDMNRLARENGGKCLSDSYENAKSRLRWRCREGHEWEGPARNVMEGRWCPHCSGRAKLTLELMKQWAREQGGRCLSKEYVNSLTKLRWRCAQGHEWESTPHNIKNGHWCPVCGGKKKLTLKDMRQWARSKGGKCLSQEYTNCNTKLRWQCRKGHLWEARPHGIRAGQWCPHCARKARLTIEEMREMAEARDGFCLSTRYINSHTKLLWQCKNGHIWQTKPATVRRGHWCPVCAEPMKNRNA